MKKKNPLFKKNKTKNGTLYNSGQHGGAAVSTVALEEEDSTIGLCGVGMFSLCLRGSPLGTPDFSHGPKVNW